MLDQKLTEIIKHKHESLINEESLFPSSKLRAFYDTFRERFGPQVLSNVDGEALLELMHDHGNREGLAYWLEFKNDDEFPAIFGSIAGGSALKFIVFRRAETGEWATRDAHNSPVTIPVDQAIDIARSNRDQLVKGAEALSRFPEGATLSDYEKLQAEMDQVAPDVGRLAWGHKYFSLLFPKLLDDYHSPPYQRFHLIKLLQNPPKGEARYLPAWWFMQIALELDMPLNHLTTILNRIHGRPYQYWRIGTTDGEDNDYWPQMLQGNYVAIGWPKVGNLADFSDGQEVEAHIREVMPMHYPSDPSVIGRKAKEIRRFCNVGGYQWFISEGDIVVAAKGMTIRGIGKVTGSYEYADENEFAHRRPVEWLSAEEWQLPEREGLRTTVSELKGHHENLVEIERKMLYAAPVELTTKVPEAAPSRPLPRLHPMMERIRSILERKGQVILYGPPGTGKTFWAQRTAYELAARHMLGQSLMQDSNRQAELRPYVHICTFHPAYGYEDFIEGYRPEVRDDHMAFVRRDGVFKALCAQARTTPERRFYLIIDEINRGDIPRIFGELLTLLEKDKRGLSISLPVSNTQFEVPPNVYVIGTMNTADRSIALLDTALRRRFGFIEMMPDTTLLANADVRSIPLDLWLSALNRRIVEHIGRDARNLQIGHAYLMDESGEPVANLASFKRILQEDIIPLLEEYCYEDYDTLKNILGEGLVDSHSQRIKFEMFSEAQEDALMGALLQLTPEITASGKALSAEASDDEVDDLQDEDDEENDS